MDNYSKEIEIAKEAAYAGAEVIQEYAQKQSFDVGFKGKNDLVTDADLETEQTIIDRLQAEFPADKIMAEESEQGIFAPESRTWIIDPIDGTTNFVHGFPVYCVSIAMWEDEEPKVGVVLEVNNGECFTAVAGKGAFLNDERIHVSNLENPQNAMIGTGFPYNKRSFAGSYLQLFEYLLHNTQSVRRPGSAAYDLCCVACGRYDGFYEHSLKPWDVGAGGLIVQEAGGKVTDWSGNDSWLLEEYMVATNSNIHSFMVDAIDKKYS